MASVEANVILKVPAEIDISDVIASIEAMITNINGLPTNVSVNEVDDMVAMSPISAIKERL